MRAQTLAAGEIIVVNDASTDSTGALVQAIQQVRYVRHPQNSGQAAARTTGARLAQTPIWHFSIRTICAEPHLPGSDARHPRERPQATLVHCDGTKSMNGTRFLNTMPR
ncbi:MAG: glycosyltransferase family 2 protein [Nitrospira sp.]|nr:glycosyltransferase family 2 protein [Nitrospira sp.]